MKGAIFVCLVLLCVGVYSKGIAWGCLGHCPFECPEGTHVYSSPCSFEIPTDSQKTCTDPLVRNLGPICDLVRCDCDEPMVMDKDSGKCVKLEDCPKPVLKESVKEEISTTTTEKTPA